MKNIKNGKKSKTLKFLIAFFLYLLRLIITYKLLFFFVFIVALLFNWVGFLVLMCLCQTVAARYGALAGFGLSLAKWTMIVKRNTEMSDLSPENRSNTWLWWLVMAFGFLICIRAVIQYMNIKRGWRLLSVPAQERVLYFY